MSIVSILEKYDEDKNFEAYGFGGMLPDGQVLFWDSCLFPIRANASNV